MSLWLPRQSPAILVRSCSRSRHVLLSHLTSRSTGAPLLIPSLRRLQSSKPPPIVSSSPEKITDTSATLSPDAKLSPPAPKGPPDAPLMTRVWKKVKHEAQHYWHGTKLLSSEVRISTRLQWKILHGEVLTRRERRQVTAKTHHFCCPLLFTCISLAETDNTRLDETYPIRSVYHRTFHGVFTPCGAKALP